MVKLSLLWEAPEVNPINGKARSIPVFNVINPYGRVFFAAWWGFFVSFWAWCKFTQQVSLRERTDRQQMHSRH